jgi:hypothetical protein
MENKDFTCHLKTVSPVLAWIERGDVDDNCPPCLLAPLASYYLGALNDANELIHASRLQEVFEGGDLLTIARVMDKIKADVGDRLKFELETLDCMAQSFKLTH